MLRITTRGRGAGFVRAHLLSNGKEFEERRPFPWIETHFLVPDIGGKHEEVMRLDPPSAEIIRLMRRDMDRLG